MALDPRYITSVELQSYFVDKDTGLPLAGGWVYFWQDNNRNNLKPVYQLTGSPPNYTYTALPNPLQLSGVGTFQDNTGDDIAVYYFPYVSIGGEDFVDNYYIEVYSASTLPPGQPQFTREAWPNVPQEGTGPEPEALIVPASNEISNSQFVEVLFNTDATYTVTLGVGITIIAIAPDWNLVVSATAGTTVTVARNAITGTSRFVTNPPYSLTVTPGGSINALSLRQRLNHNPAIWSETVPATGGWISGSFALAPNSPQVIMSYAPSNGSQQTILSGNNIGGGLWRTYNNTVQLLPGDNTDSSTVGYVDIVLTLNTGTATTLSSVQVLGLDRDEDVAYTQVPVNRQLDNLFHYYKPQLESKPLPSYLVGWDFPLNPAQILGNTVAASAIGANKSKYVWDQTIVFQSVDSGAGVTRAANGGITLTQTGSPGQMALIQYLDSTQAKEILQGRSSVALSGFSSELAGITGTISLWVTNDAQLPDLKSPNFNSLVATLDANGKPATLNGAGWQEIPRSNRGNAFFSLAQTTTEVDFSGWDMSGNALQTTATYFAIVIGFAQMAATDTVSLNWVGLNTGDIATRPAPKTQDEVIDDCSYFYEQSYPLGSIAGAITDLNVLLKPQVASIDVASGPPTVSSTFATGFDIVYRSIKRAVPTFTFYSNISGTAGNVRSWATGGTNNNGEITASTRWTAYGSGVRGISFTPTGGGALTTVQTVAPPDPAQGWITFQYVADARLGIVL